MYMTGDTPVGPFTLRGPLLRNPTLNGKNINRNNNNHAAQIEYKGKWYLFYHDRRAADANGASSVNQRNISVDSLVYNADGTMKEVVVTENGVAQIKNFNPYNTISATTMNRQSSSPTADKQPGIKADSIAGEGMILTRIANNNWVRLKGVDFGAGAAKFTVRAASNNSSGGTIELRTGSAAGTLVGTCDIASTGGWNTWKDFEADISNAVGVKDFLYLVFKGTGSELFRLSRYQFHEVDAASVSGGVGSARHGSAPRVTVIGKTLAVNEPPETELRIRVMNLNGRTAAIFNTCGKSSVQLRKIPAGTYIVEAKRAGDGVKTTSAITLR
jgi:arabinoxylan arabinofuranohydrolase